MFNLRNSKALWLNFVHAKVTLNMVTNRKIYATTKPTKAGMRNESERQSLPQQTHKNNTVSQRASGITTHKARLDKAFTTKTGVITSMHNQRGRGMVVVSSAVLHIMDLLDTLHSYECLGFAFLDLTMCWSNVPTLTYLQLLHIQSPYSCCCCPSM